MDIIAAISPGWAANRAAERVRLERLRAEIRSTPKRSRRSRRRRPRERDYDGASKGRRFSGWITGNDKPTDDARQLAILRRRARHMARNNPHAAQALEAIVSNTVGIGIQAQITGAKRAQVLWKRWAHTTECDADGVHDLFGLQALVMRAVAESGEVFVRARRRKVSEGFSVPLQLQVLEAEFLDVSKHGKRGGNDIVGGIEYDARGRRVAYYFHTEHPSSQLVSASQRTVRVDAANVAHVYRRTRPGQARGASWLAPVLTRLKNLDLFEDATIDKQKIAACVAAFVTDDGEGATVPRPPDDPAGDELTEDELAERLEYLEPGVIEYLPPGKTITFSNPPSSTDYAEFVAANLRAIAAGLGMPYEVLSNDLRKTSFSSARIGWLEFDRRIQSWRRQIIIPMFCTRVFNWWALAVGLQYGLQNLSVEWTSPHREMLNPREEVTAMLKRVRGGLLPMPEALRQSGQDPDAVVAAIREWNEKIDEAGLVLDSDPRRTSQGGQGQQDPADDEEEKNEAEAEDEVDDDLADAAE
jgi:lambda family phage portal protein